MSKTIPQVKMYTRNKWIYHTPGIKLDEAVDNAMQEYADQQTEAKDARIKELEEALKNLSKAVYLGDAYATYLRRADELLTITSPA